MVELVNEQRDDCCGNPHNEDSCGEEGHDHYFFLHCGTERPYGRTLLRGCGLERSPYLLVYAVAPSLRHLTTPNDVVDSVREERDHPRYDTHHPLDELQKTSEEAEEEREGDHVQAEDRVLFCKFENVDYFIHAFLLWSTNRSMSRTPFRGCGLAGVRL